MPELSRKYGALFELYGQTPQGKKPEPKPRAAAHQAMLARIPEGGDKEALVELLGIISRHPVKVWGKRRENGWLRLGLEADPDWQEQNGSTWKRAHGLWVKALHLIARYGMDTLPWPKYGGPEGGK